MAQDLRNMFKEHDGKEVYPMKKGHEERFVKRLDKEFPQKKKSFFFILKIAASILVLVSVGMYTYRKYSGEAPIKTTVVDKDRGLQENSTISLGDLSPDLKRVENYYVANISMELSQLELSQDNEALVNSFMERLAELNEEYKKLNVELNEIGPNDQTITALIKNLQLRLQLLHKLKEKLNELKSSENEEVTTNSI